MKSLKVAQLLGIEWFGMNVIHTGGNYMTDGSHHSSSTTLVWEENPSQTHEQIAEKMLNYLGIDNYMVQEDPNGTYIDHIDCWGKFLGPDKVLIRKVPISHPQYTEIEATAAFYASQLSSYGTPYRVFRVNTPNDEPYSNSYIMNNKVFVPFLGTSNDAGALLAYQQAMPGYQITGYLELPSASWESTDALHCRTHEMSDRGMLYIDHLPLHGSLPAQQGFTINADITAYSQQAIYSDSVWLIYKVENSLYDTIPMVNSSANHYSAVIPGQIEGSTVAYYIHAEDASGRSANHPFIGAPDPHVFEIAVSTPPALVIAPDTLYFETVEDIVNGKTVYVKNYTTQSISINQINKTGTGPLQWYIDPWALELPYIQPSGETLELLVKIAIPVGKTEWICDSLLMQTDFDSYRVMICADPYLLSGIQNKKELSSLNVYPNPASQSANFTFLVENPAPAQLEIMTIDGKLTKKITKTITSSGMQTINWMLDDNESKQVIRGLYFYRLTVGQQSISGKISVNR
ncbi:MAG: agmatine deiminase family protein [Bacteroidales bacterium]|nr:agmatine deiminase family protein [Bacteroidales bacterium]